MAAYEYETHDYDVVVVGAGGAGLRATIAAAKEFPDLNIACLSKVYPMRSHTVSAEGGAAAVIKAEDSLDAHAYDTISGGDWMCDQDAVEAFVREALAEVPEAVLCRGGAYPAHVDHAPLSAHVPYAVV